MFSTHFARRAGLTAAGAMVALGTVTVGPASATDAYPCGPVTPVGSRYQTSAQYCPLIQGNVPVYDSPAERHVVGYLTQGGSANYFFGQSQSLLFQLNGTNNVWWAATVADNGTFGWVPENYFRGGDNFEKDSGLQAYVPPAPTQGM